MMPKCNYRAGKHNPKVRKSSASQQCGRRATPFNAAKFARNCKKAEQKGNARWWSAATWSWSEGEPDSWSKREPEVSNAGDMDIDPKAVDEQTTNTIELTGIENAFGSQMLLDGPSTESPTADLPVIMKKAIVNSLSEPKVSTRSEHEHSEEMDTDTIATDSNANTSMVHYAYPSASSEESITTGHNDPLPVEGRYYLRIITKDSNNSAGVPYETVAIEDHDMSSVQDLHETSVTENHNMEVEFVHDPSGADYTEKPTKQPNETSNTADLGTTSHKSIDDKTIKTKPCNLMDLSDDMLQQILRHVIVSGKFIRPYWNLGASQVAAEVSCKENFPTIPPAFASNRRLVDEATKILYGKNVFILEHAKVSLWWLKRISSNVPKLKRLIISVEEGPMDCFRTRFESIWYTIFLLLEQEHNLQRLKVLFQKWTLDIYHLCHNSDGLNPVEDTCIWEPRYGVIRTLLGFRGLRYASVEHGVFVNRYIADTIQQALVMTPGQTNQNVDDLVEHVQGPIRSKYYF